MTPASSTNDAGLPIFPGGSELSPEAIQRLTARKAESATPVDVPAPADKRPEKKAPSCSGLSGLDLLLRSPQRFLDVLNETTDPAPAIRTLLLAAMGAAIAFGAAVGSFRGGRQMVFAAIKLPIVELLTAAICAPALAALNSAVHGVASLRRDFALILAALTLGTLLAAALAPVVLLASASELDYHRAVLLLVGVCAVSGGYGLSVLLSGLRGEPDNRAIVGFIMLALIATVGAQMSWVLRPYLVRPGTHQVPFVRAVEDDFVTSVVTDVDSARGYFQRVTGGGGMSR